MAEWIPVTLGAEALSSGEPPEVVLLLSPYFQPEAVRGFPVRGGEKFRIEFRYIDGKEPEHRVTVNAHVSVFEGRHTRRILAIEVDLRALGAKSIGVAFENALSEAAQKTGNKYVFEAQRAFAAKRDQVLAAAVA